MNLSVLLWLKLVVFFHFELINSVLSKSCSIASSECSVKIKNLGHVSGVQLNTVFGGKPFCGYKGIRFGQAPVGDLRFKAPVPSGPWQGVLNASNYSAACIQTSAFPGAPPSPNQSEDCLFLNVFVPSAQVCKCKSKIPVIIYIYGGAFTVGYADDSLYGPQLILNQCVILVTFNYRVGVFGFLPLGLPEYSGNMALKDQQLAMKWVKKHISSFGGDTNRILLLGESAGAVSVGYHLLNKKSKKYFRRAFGLSSSVLNYYGRMESNDLRPQIRSIAEQLGQSISTDEQLIDILKSLSTEIILKYTFNNGIYGRTFGPVWSPVIENEHAIKPFITRDPLDIYDSMSSDCNDIPSTIFSHTPLEYISFDTAEILNTTLIEDLNTNFNFQLPFHDFNQAACENQVQPLLNQIRQFYFGDAVINGSTISQYVRMLSYMNFIYPVQKDVVIRAKKAKCPQRFQINNMKSPLNIYSGSVPALAALPGAAHADDICYIFYCDILSPIYELIEQNKDSNMIYMNAYKTSREMIELLVSFAATGNPTSKTGKLNNFPEVSRHPVHNMSYVEVTNSGELTVGTNPATAEFLLWHYIDQRVQLLRKFGCNN